MKLPRVSGFEVVKALARIGYEVERRRGSHVRLIREGDDHLSVPLHPELDRGTLRSIIRDAKLTVEEFIALLK